MPAAQLGRVCCIRERRALSRRSRFRKLDMDSDDVAIG